MAVLLGCGCMTNLQGKRAAADGDVLLDRPKLAFDGKDFVDFASRASSYNMIAVLPFKRRRSWPGKAFPIFSPPNFLRR